ncbi:MAG: polyphosphate kinase 1 [Chromatiales bacterium]|nr:polyphosphate kinase 1 [Chromatiales bacterium]
MSPDELSNPEFYINRELSLLEFNERVLQQVNIEDVPLLERLKYLCISSSNLDEFFEIRVAGLKQIIEFESPHLGPENINIHDLLSQISERAHRLVDEQYQLLNDKLLPELKEEGIHFLKRSEWNAAQQEWVREFFEMELLPMLTPIGLDPSHPFPRILNKSLHFIITLKGKDAFGRNRDMAILPAPRALPRLIQLDGKKEDRVQNYVFLSSIIHAHIEDFFPGMKVTGCYQFRVTRNSDLIVDEDVVEDLLSAMEGELPSRRYGDETRLETADNCPNEISQFLLEQFGLTDADHYQCQGLVNINRLMALPDMVNRPELTFPLFSPSIPPRLRKNSDIFTTIRKGDILLHHPFHSFTPVIDFLRQAAADPGVLSIKQTLYRTTGLESPIIKALIAAARAGKEVIVVVELRARFDEEANIALAHQLQEAGALVVYGVVGYKTHAKMIHVVRREGEKLRNYIHLGTGNYHARTARLYTDYGLLSCDEKMAQDVHQIFLQLTSLGRSKKLNKMLQSPFTLFKGIISRIDREAKNASEGVPSRIIAKMNSLVEPEVIKALYRASQAGVKIELIIRGICCLRPGIKDVSENIRVVSVVGRFLEHTRVYYFQNDDSPELFGSSADWMGRNLHHRVESCFPIEEKGSRAQIIEELELYLSDNCQAWNLNADAEYKRVVAGKNKPKICAQRELIEQLASWD